MFKTLRNILKSRKFYGAINKTTKGFLENAIKENKMLVEENTRLKNMIEELEKKIDK